MASAGKLAHMQPVRISELMGFPKSAGKEPVSERKRLEPVKIKQLLESSASKSCSRTNDRTTRPTFLIPGRGVRRKLYDRSPSPRATRLSICPKSSSRTQNIPQKSQNAPNPAPRTSQLPQKLRQSLFPSKPLTRTARKSFLLPPNSIVKNHMVKSVHENSMLSTCHFSEEETQESEEPVKNNGNPKEPEPETDQEVDQMRPTVIMSTQSSKKSYKRVKESTAAVDAAKSKDSDSMVETELEKSLENKENIPPSPELPKNPLGESKTVPLDPMTSEVLQEALKRIGKIETDVGEAKKINTRILEVLEGIYDLLKHKKEGSEETRRISGALSQIEGIDKENLGGSRRSKDTPATQGRRRSARLAKQQSTPPKVDVLDDSFAVLEQQLNAKTPKTKGTTPAKKTPVHDQFLRRRCKSERALREYLAIKASMSYLQTPEAGKLKNAQTPSGKGNLRRSISRKVFDELQDLYSDDIEENSS